MPRPHNPRELIEKDHPKGVLDLQNYMVHFAPYEWTYGAGYHEIVSHIPIWNPSVPSPKAAKEYVKGFRTQALLKIPDAWRKSMDSADWTHCNEKKINMAAQPAAIRFDKISIATIALELAIDALRTTQGTTMPVFDLYHYISLRPAIFVLDNLRERDQAFLKNDRLANGEAKHFEKLRNKFAYGDAAGVSPDNENPAKKAERFLLQVAEGYGITYHNALVIRDYFRDSGMSQLTVRVMDGRNDGGRKVSEKEPNAFEPVHIAVDDALNPAGIQGLRLPMENGVG
jgi:hypothetical protein